MSSADPAKCIILVPVGGTIVPECDDALRVLETRGYTVWRIRGYSAIDAGRCQMASDALVAGFEELFWIDSDVVFNPDDVDKLRQHPEPFVCGIYPKKGQRQFAANFLPGTSLLTFGESGALSEILYTGFGFNLTRRVVYEDIRQKLELPRCNERFGRPLIPYFMPFVHDDGTGTWYLSEDYAFCERARQCGHRVMVDSTIRLWHVGTYAYSWEEAGSTLERYATYHYTIGTALPGSETALPGDSTGRWSHRALQQVCRESPWPAEVPAVPAQLCSGGRPLVQGFLSQHANANSKLVMHIGAKHGLSTRFILEQSCDVAVIAIDDWPGQAGVPGDKGHSKHSVSAWETFLANCWSHRDRLLPLRMSRELGLTTVADSGVVPTMVFLEGSRLGHCLRQEIETVLHCFPAATIVGDDWDWSAVRAAVMDVTQATGRKLTQNGLAWQLEPAAAS